ncbi:precorrin-6A synthase (deacetylating) [Planotetraspora phitsanulokensis]|uniref:Precorrin-6A synthase (Deacetylating) n=1 Tax=Planotetraspora phitsanulokensis TaxID=575192 RepID=A0A8J3XD29_9ACTN|nr:precorrin-6A synthase (deacetylating) [Planotetraspora phitsanulokensis]GII36171.1 precorrin-6A synthase (deacetylating) [Planotetraspora phitsanulokensis]
MKRVLIIGIGAGDPDHLTLQAVKAIAAADVFFVLGKGSGETSGEVPGEGSAHDLVRLRRNVIGAHAREPYRVVEARDPERDRTGDAYSEAVEDWRARRADVYERLILDELGQGQTGAILVWGDPSLYDSTLAVVDEVLARGSARFDHTVIPGVSSVSALAARHRVSLTRVARPLQVTTGRRLARAIGAGTGPAGGSDEFGDVVVMLDAHCAFTDLPDGDDVDIYWGAYLGTPDEILISGRVRDVAERIRETRAQARARKGWIMDTYLLRRAPEAGERPPSGTGVS